MADGLAWDDLTPELEGPGVGIRTKGLARQFQVTGNRGAATVRSGVSAFIVAMAPAQSGLLQPQGAQSWTGLRERKKGGANVVDVSG